jgi:stage III sporulation protein SpoIIIAA
MLMNNDAFEKYREIARILADEGKKRVIIVDTSNEIGGDGDVPHSGIGRARRMQVPKVTMQHNVGTQSLFINMIQLFAVEFSRLFLKLHSQVW